MVAGFVGLLLKAFFILVIAKALPGVRIGGYGSALGVAVVYAALSWALKGLLVFLTFPFILVTFGLFLLVLNGFLLWVTDKLMESFEIKNLPAHALATLGITLSTIAVDHVVGRIF